MVTRKKEFGCIRTGLHHDSTKDMLLKLDLDQREILGHRSPKAQLRLLHLRYQRCIQTTGQTNLLAFRPAHGGEQLETNVALSDLGSSLA